MRFIKKSIFVIFIFFFNINLVNGSENIVFMDIDYVLNNSKLGKSIYSELDKLNKDNLKKLNSKEKLIKEKKDKIEKKKNVSSQEQLEKDVNLFNKEVDLYRNEKNKLLNEFKKIKKNKLDDFLIKINPLIQEYIKKNSIDLVLEKNQIFMGNTKIDITNDIVKLIDKNF